jgi:hypothetical protein
MKKSQNIHDQGLILAQQNGFGLAQQNGFGPAFLHSKYLCWRLTKRQRKA